MKEKEKQFIEYVYVEINKQRRSFETSGNNMIDGAIYSAREDQCDDILEKFKQIFNIK